MASPNPTRTASGGVDIEAWTQSTATALSDLHLSPAPPSPHIRGTATTLDIPLDAEPPARTRKPAAAASPAHAQPQAQEQDNDEAYPVYKPPRPIRRRDSLARREALLKGKEGSRRRQKWENGTLTPSPMRTTFVTNARARRPPPRQPLRATALRKRLVAAPDAPGSERAVQRCARMGRARRALRRCEP